MKNNVVPDSNLGTRVGATGSEANARAGANPLYRKEPILFPRPADSIF